MFSESFSTAKIVFDPQRVNHSLAGISHHHPHPKAVSIRVSIYYQLTHTQSS